MLSQSENLAELNQIEAKLDLAVYITVCFKTAAYFNQLISYRLN